MDQPHRHSAVSYRGSTPLDRASAHFTRREYSRQARLQEERFPRTFLPGVLIQYSPPFPIRQRGLSERLRDRPHSAHNEQHPAGNLAALDPRVGHTCLL
jgi:hypothetical protein